MKTITFHCETITPMFLAGADGQTPELRPPSIKGALRFWWRAMNAGNYDTIPKLKEAESKIFGGTDEKAGRSKVIISTHIIKECIKKEHISLTPHHDYKYCSKEDKYKTGCNFGKNNKKSKCTKSRKQNATFTEFDLNIRFNENAILIDKLEKTIKTTFLLGGFGKRSRRGFGSQYLEIDNEPVFNNLEDIRNFMEQIPKNNSDLDFPTIKDIQIGGKFNNYFEVLKFIGKNTHDNFSKAKKDRHASPIYVSVIKPNKDKEEYYPIVTELKYECSNFHKDKDKNKKFKDAFKIN